MDRDPTQPLTPHEAREQLRAAAARMGLAPWVRRRPFGAVASGLAAGFLAGRVPRLWHRLARSTVGHVLLNRLR